MKKLVFKILILASPYLLYSIVIVAIDPFNLFAISPLFSDLLKKKVMRRSVNTCMYDNAIYCFAEFKRNHFPNVIIGDSRPFLFDMDYINNKSTDKYANLSIPGGGALNVICDSLEFALKTASLRKVLIGISFEKSSAKNRSYIVPKVEKMLCNKFKYFANKRVLDASYALLTYSETARKTTDKMTKWKTAINNQPLDSYEYPFKELARLKSLVEYCKRNNIETRFIIFPNHNDINLAIESHNLSQYQNQFLNDLAAITTVYNYAYKNEFTTNYDNYNDPMHAKSWVYNRIADDIFDLKTHDKKAWNEFKIPFQLYDNGALQNVQGQ